jgi:hypothetical protein
LADPIRTQPIVKAIESLHGQTFRHLRHLVRAASIKSGAISKFPESSGVV